VAGLFVGRAWTAAWLTVRRRTYLGPREILDDPEWSAELAWLDRHSFKHSWHRPDLVGFLADRAIAIEVELAPKSKPTKAKARCRANDLS
jgi:hypothetical protein